METWNHVYYCFSHKYSDPTYEAWKLDKSYFVFIFLVLIPILPMRHGNPNQPPTPFQRFLKNSDPTYEAWKRILPNPDPILRRNSDPTYEAWKQKMDWKFWAIVLDSDPTYEAWKQFFSKLSD